MGKAKSALKSQEWALALARETAEAAAALEGVVAVYLVGSRARGDYRADSDVDLAVVVKGRLVERRLELARRLHRPRLDIIPVEEAWWCGDSPIAKALRSEAVLLAGTPPC